MLFHRPQIFPHAGGTVVDHHHLFALLKEAFNQMRTDKSRPAGDQNMRRLTMEDGGWHRLKAEGGWRMEDGEWQRTILYPPHFTPAPAPQTRLTFVGTPTSRFSALPADWTSNLLQ